MSVADPHGRVNVADPQAGLVTQLYDEVAAHPPGDDREAWSRRRILALLTWLPRPLDQQADPIHVTGSAIVHDGAGRVLLHRHKRLGRWLQPGGHLDAGEHPAEAAQREAREETGVLLAPDGRHAGLLHLDVHEGPRGHVHLDLRYLLTAPAGAVPDPAVGESPVVRWFPLAAARAVSDVSLRAALAATDRVTSGRDGPR